MSNDGREYSVCEDRDQRSREANLVVALAPCHLTKNRLYQTQIKTKRCEFGMIGIAEIYEDTHQSLTDVI